MAPSPRSMASWLNSATLCVPGPGTWPPRRTAPWTGDRGGRSGCGAAYPSRVFPMCDAMGDVGRNGLCRFLPKRREAGPVVDVDQHRAAGLRKGDIAPEHLEPEDRRRLERERPEPVLVHRGPLAGESRFRAVPIEK